MWQEYCGAACSAQRNRPLSTLDCLLDVEAAARSVVDGEPWGMKVLPLVRGTPMSRLMYVVRTVRVKAAELEEKILILILTYREDMGR